MKPAPGVRRSARQRSLAFFGQSSGPEGPTAAWGAGKLGPDDAALPQFGKVWQAYAGERLEDVSLSRADAAGRGGLGSRAKDAASGHRAHRTSVREPVRTSVPSAGLSGVRGARRPPAVR